MPGRFVRFARLATALCVSAWLTACGTAPDKPVDTSGASLPTSPPAVASTPTLRSPDYADTSGGPGDAADLPAVTSIFSITSAAAPPTSSVAVPADESRPPVLAGEILKEFQRGHASWYGPGFHGRRTASGERFDMQDLTAAHRTLPFGTVVRVHSLVNGRDVDVRITDRGPYAGNRIIDLSRAAAEELGMLGLGFKEVVLLLPDSIPTDAVAASPPPAKKRFRPVTRRAPQGRTR